MKALIIAAGSGRRIPQFSNKFPKSLIKINNETLLERQIRFFRSLKIRKIAVIVGHKHEKITKKIKNVKFYYNYKFKKNEQLDSMFVAKKFFTEDIIVVFSDIIYEKKIILSLKNCNKKKFLIAARKHWKRIYKYRFDHPVSQADKIISRNGRVLSIGKNISANKANGEFLGMFKISKNFLVNLIHIYNNLNKNKSKKMQINDLIKILIKKKIIVNSINVSGKYMEIDTYNDYKIANHFFSHF